MTLRSELTTRNIKDISVLLKRVVSTIYEDLGRRPQNVPLPLKYLVITGYCGLKLM